MNQTVARLYLVDDQAFSVPIPHYIQTTAVNGAAVARLAQNWLISWSESYILTVNGNQFLRLTNHDWLSFRQEVVVSAPKYLLLLHKLNKRVSS